MEGGFLILGGGTAVSVSSLVALTVASPQSQGAGEWIGTLAALAGIVTITTTGINAYFNRAMRLAINEKVEQAKATILQHLDEKTERLREELARKDLTEQRFREVERRTLRLEITKEGGLIKHDDERG